MARRSRSQSSSPNKVLVIFLVVFILTTLGAVVWAYTLLKARDTWDQRAAEKDKALKESAQTADWYKYQRDELLAAVGVQEFLSKAENVKTWKDNRKKYMERQLYQGADGEEEFRKTMDLLQKTLSYDDGYKNKFAELPDQLRAELAALKDKHAAKTAEFNAKMQEFVALEKKFNADRDKTLKEMQAGNDKIFAARKETSEQMTLAFRQNEELQKKLAASEAEFNKILASKDLALSGLKQLVKVQDDAGKNPNRSLGDVHALFLDISRGKPLWDAPRGKIVRVDDGGKKVFIDKGSKDGVKPGLTFNVFAAGLNGRGEGELRATIEVIRVDDPRMSLCKVNTFYDADGREITVAEATPARLFFNGGSGLKEGDLLFNVCWGTHVAFAGIVDFAGQDVSLASVQFDNLKEMMGYVERMGMTVDAFIDPRDGKLVGGLSSKTNFVIRGYKANVQKDGAEEKRVKGINDNIKALQDQAIDGGMFVISVENFGVVTGFRRPGSSDAQTTLSFVPRPPSGPPIPPPAAGAGPPPDTKKN